MSDLAALLDGTVDDVKGRMGDLSVETLTELRAAELASSSPRSTLVSAIDAAIAAAQEQATADAAKGDGARMFSQEEVDALIAEREAAWKADADRRVAAAKGAAAPKPAKVKPAKPLSIDVRSTGSALTVLTEGATVVFVDDERVPLTGVPPLTFAADAFEPAGDNAVKLKREVKFPNTLAGTEVSGAFVLDGEGDPVGRATLIAPQPIGAGRDVVLPPGTLLFTKE